MKEADPGTAAKTVTGALALFEGWPCTAVVDVAVAEHSRMEQSLIALRELDGELRLQSGSLRELVADLEAAVVEFPFNATFWSQLMQALNRSGRQVEALRAYQRFVTVLADLGLDPPPDVRRLESEIITQESLGSFGDAEAPLPGDAESAIIHTVRRAGIPQPRTSLFGRRAEIAVVMAALRTNRLVSIVGIGGSGKTRLALAAAQRLEADGVRVYQLGLGRISDPALIVPMLVTVSGLAAPGITTSAELAELLAEQDLVFVLDNCEHLLSECRTIVNDLLDIAPNVRILVTTRERLRVVSEEIVLLGPLETTIDGQVNIASPAVALFLERSQARSNRLSQDPEALVTVAAICRALDGLPLAIELAAAQMAYMGPAQLLDLVGAAEGISTLRDGSGHASLASVLDWCWQSLTPNEQLVLARLSVFPDSWPYEATDPVGGTGESVSVALAELINKGLISVQTDARRPRYAMLETVRAFALDQLGAMGEQDATHDRLVAWLQDLVGQWSIPELWVTAAAVEVVRAEQHNIGRALMYLRQADRREELTWLAVKANCMWFFHGLNSETERWLTPLAVDEQVSRPARSAAEYALGGAAYFRDQNTEAVAHMLRSIELSDGAPHDWIPMVAAPMPVACLVVPTPRDVDFYWNLAIETAKEDPSSYVKRAIVAEAHGGYLFAVNEFEAALEAFETAERLHREPGGLLCRVETCKALTLMRLGRTSEAAEYAREWRSRSETDEQHYVIDIVRAIVIGCDGDVATATADLTRAAEKLTPAYIGGRIDDFQMAFGFLADYRGDRDLAEQLLARPVGQHIVLTSLLIKHLMEYRGVDTDEGHVAIALEVLTRDLLDQPTPTREMVIRPSELIRWWTTGER